MTAQTLDGESFQLSDFVSTDGLGHTSTRPADDTIPAEPLFPDRVFRRFLNQINTNLQDLANLLRTTSATSDQSIGTGPKTLVLDVDKPFVAGQFVQVNDAAAVTNWMFGQVTSYTSGTKTLVINVTKTNGSGTPSSWNVYAAGPAGDDGTFDINSLGAETVTADADEFAFYDTTAANNKKITRQHFYDDIAHYVASKNRYRL